MLAGDESRASNPLFADFAFIGQELEKLGFTYSRGDVFLIDPLKVQ